MGAILSRFNSHKDEKSTTTSNSTSIRKRWSWRSNKKPADVGGTTVNRSSTMPTRTRLQPTEEIPEDRKHEEIFDNEHDEKSYSNSVVKPNQNDHSLQHSSEQQEQYDVKCTSKTTLCEVSGKDEKQPIQTSSIDKVTRTISTEEAELLIDRVLSNRENIDPHETITVSETNSSLTHDNPNFNHTEDLIANKQQLQGTINHSIPDSDLVVDQQKFAQDQNKLVDDTKHHFENKIDLFKKDSFHSEIPQEDIVLEKNPTVPILSQEIEEFMHQNIQKHDSTERLDFENNSVEQRGEENLYNENFNHKEEMKPSPLICDLIHEQVVGSECLTEPSALHNLSNNEELPTSEPTDTNNKINFDENSNISNNVISGLNEQTNVFEETMEKEFNASIINPDETQSLSTNNPPIKLDEDMYIEQTENISSSENVEHAIPTDEEVIQDESVKCYSQPGLEFNPVHSVSPVNTESIDLDEDMHAEQTEKTSLIEHDVNNDMSLEGSIRTDAVDRLAEPGMEYNYLSNESHFTPGLVFGEETTKNTDAEQHTEDLNIGIHHEQINDTETMITLEESVDKLQNSQNSTYINDYNDQHQNSELSYHENQTDSPLNSDITDVITSENIHTNLINANNVPQKQDVFDSMSVNDDNDITRNLENSKNIKNHEFEDEAESLVQSVLNTAKEYVFNENNFESHHNINPTDTNMLTISNDNDNLNNKDGDTNEDDTIDIKQDMTMKTSMEFDHSNVSELNNQFLNNTNDFSIA
ncbi:unnamed protein product [Schistosoma turkestanicum]|nr:unnamed protein product [Schistosoma turkestanicum]